MECHTKGKILETKNKQKILTDKLEIHIIQLDKLKENGYRANKRNYRFNNKRDRYLIIN